MKPLNIICAFVSVVCAALCLIAMCNHYPRELGFDYIGVIVAILGVIVAVLVGWQIYNAVRLQTMAEKCDEIIREGTKWEEHHKKDIQKLDNKQRCNAIQQRLFVLGNVYMKSNPIEYIKGNIYSLMQYSQIINSNQHIDIQILYDALYGLSEALNIVIALRRNNDIQTEDIAIFEDITTYVKSHPIDLQNEEINAIIYEITSLLQNVYDNSKKLDNSNNNNNNSKGVILSERNNIEQNIADIQQKLISKIATPSFWE